MLPAVVLTIAIKAQFWRSLEKQGKAEWSHITYYQSAVLHRTNT